jgi:hypothetical protein
MTIVKEAGLATIDMKLEVSTCKKAALELCRAGVRKIDE